LALLVLGTTTAAAQYRFDHWTTDNGLPQNSVRDVVQTRDGYVWLTTFDGLVRFDGVRFTVFNKGNSPGLPGNRFASLVEDREGDLWASTEFGEVVRQHQGRFTTYGQAQGLPAGQVPSLAADAQGNLIVYYVHEDAGKRVPSLDPFFRWSAGRFERTEAPRYDFPALILPLDEAQSVRWARIIDGDFWIATSRRLVRYPQRGGVQVYDDRHGLPGTPMTLLAAKNLPLQAVSRDATGRVWLTDLESQRSHLLSTQAPPELRLGSADGEGTYWFGTQDNGLFRARRQTVVPQGLDLREVYPLLERRDGSVWIGAAGQGLFRLDRGAFTQYPPHIENHDSFSGVATSLYEDRAGDLWINGCWRFVNGRYMPAPWADAIVFPSKNEAWTMTEDRAGAYWIGMTDGVVRYQHGTITHFTTKDGLAGNDTKVIIDDGQGGLWLGSYGGLTHYRDGRFTAWTEKDGLPGATVRALRLDPDGTLWIGTYDSGLGRFKDGRFTRYTTKDGLFDDGVFQILEDDGDRLWMSGNRGIARVNRQELIDFAEGRRKAITALAYNKSDGMPSAECNGGRWPAGVRTRDGKLWFPTMAGLAMIDPAGVQTNPQPPPVVIEAMRVNNQPVSTDSWEAALQQPQRALEILPGQDNFEIAYTALSFINSENIRFRYRLEGADAEWVEAGTRRTAYFSHLSPGDYVFHVIAAKSDGAWNERGASVRIRVPTPYWRTPWFVTLALLAVAGLIAAAWQYRVSQLRGVQRAQQAFARQLIE
jgi:ligand-binding sensor domain-containing protein